MASKGLIDQALNALPSEMRGPLQKAFYYLMDNWRLGGQTRAENAQWYAVESTTASVANTEFSFKHGLGAAPSKFIPILRVDAVNAQLVPLTVSRAADAERIYLKSTSTSAVFFGYVEI